MGGLTDLENLLESCYQGLEGMPCHLKEACIDSISDFTSKNKDISNESLENIKRLTKVAYHIIRESDRLDTHLERIYDYTKQGVKKAEEGADKISPQRIDTINSHLNGYAGNIAMEIFKRKKGHIEWAKNAYHAYRISAEKSRVSEPDFSAYCSRDAAKAAIEISRAYCKSMPKGEAKKLCMKWNNAAIAHYANYISYINAKNKGLGRRTIFVVVGNESQQPPLEMPLSQKTQDYGSTQKYLH